MIRPRRNRRTPALREMVREYSLKVTDLIMPMFVVGGTGVRREIGALPEVYHLSVDMAVEEAKAYQALGLRAVLLFGVLEPGQKDSCGSEAFNDEGYVQQAARAIKAECPDMVVFSDVCMCQYTDHGHCGILSDDGEVINDVTIGYLERIALSHARAGVDFIAPSDMMDGRVGALRQALNAGGFADVGILSYAVKYASNFYGPFREAAHSTPGFGDRKAYQMDYHNRREAQREWSLDEAEGADMLMVKPAGVYLDILSDMRRSTTLPVVSYHVSGEYAMLYNAVKAGILSPMAIYEQMVALKRAGSDLIITYFAPYLAKELMHHEGRL